MAKTWPSKDPNEVLDYVIDWNSSDEPNPGWAVNDTIATSSWTVPVGITKDSDSHGNTTTTIWLSGGTLGETYTLVNRITTVGGRTLDQTVRIKIKEH